MRHFQLVFQGVGSFFCLLVWAVDSWKKLQHPTRPVENVTLTTKGLQGKKLNIEWDDDEKIGNKNKLVLTDSSHRCMKHDISKYLF